MNRRAHQARLANRLAAEACAGDGDTDRSWDSDDVESATSTRRSDDGDREGLFDRSDFDRDAESIESSDATPDDELRAPPLHLMPPPEIQLLVLREPFADDLHVREETIRWLWRTARLISRWYRDEIEREAISVWMKTARWTVTGPLFIGGTVDPLASYRQHLQLVFERSDDRLATFVCEDKADAGPATRETVAGVLQYAGTGYDFGPRTFWQVYSHVHELDLPLSLSPKGDPFFVTVPWRPLISQLFAEETAVLKTLADGTADFLSDPPPLAPVELDGLGQEAQALALARARQRQAYARRRCDRAGVGKRLAWNEDWDEFAFDAKVDAARRRAALSP